MTPSTGQQDGVCRSCGRTLDSHDRHIRFELPDPVLAVPIDERADRTWGNDVLMQVQGVGSFVRVLLPVRLTGGHAITFGLWLGVHPDDLLRAYEEWFAPTYSGLVLEGRIANEAQPWKLLGAPARAVVRDPDEVPYIDSSTDETLQAVVDQEWEHELVLAGLPQHLR